MTVSPLVNFALAASNLFEHTYSGHCFCPCHASNVNFRFGDCPTSIHNPAVVACCMVGWDFKTKKQQDDLLRRAVVQMARNWQKEREELKMGERPKGMSEACHSIDLKKGDYILFQNADESDAWIEITSEPRFLTRPPPISSTSPRIVILQLWGMKEWMVFEQATHTIIRPLTEAQKLRRVFEELDATAEGVDGGFYHALLADLEQYRP
jgi:hypothetical protein